MSDAKNVFQLVGLLIAKIVKEPIPTYFSVKSALKDIYSINMTILSIA